MPATNSSSHCVVRCDTSRTALAVLCVIALVATSVIAYRMGINRNTAAARYTATATIHHGLHPSNGHESNPSVGPVALSAADVERQIVSRENLDRILRQIGIVDPEVAGNEPSGSGGRIAERIGEGLRVTAAETSSPAGLRISVQCTYEDADRVVWVVNALAEDYREQCRARREASIARQWDEARDAAERARQQFLKAQGRFDDFVGQHFHKQQALAEHGPRLSVPQPPSVEPVDLEAPGKNEDLGRIGLERQLADLEACRDELLTSRTPMHPVVLATEQRIARLEERLASIPLESPREEKVVSSSSEGRLAAAEAELEYAATAREFGARKETLDRARQEYERLLALQRGSRAGQFQGANIEVELADTSEAIGPVAASSGLVLVALAAGLAVAAGVGLIKSGFDTDPPLESLEQAQTALRIPIVGVIPAADGAADRAADEPRRFSGGLAKIISGASLVAVSFAFLALVY
jgi:hypothetical protein